MLYLAMKSVLSGLLAALVSEIAKRSPAFGALVASLPLISVMAVIWLWRDTGDAARIASHMEATFWPALAAGCGLTFVLYLLTAWVAGHFGIRL
jgi:hypothetical protein